MFPSTVFLMQFLRNRNQSVRRNNLRIDPWVDTYVDSCLTAGHNVTLVTQWCLSKGLERRFGQADCFVPTSKEIELWSEHIPAILSVFSKLGLGLDWYFTFNRGFTPSRRLSVQIEMQYKELVLDLAEKHLGCSIAFFDWEEEVLGGHAQPDLEVLSDPHRFVSERALQRELAWADQWMKDETNLVRSPEEIRQDVLVQIAYEAAEGRFLSSSACPFGPEFILVPLEAPEQYDFFSVFVPDFKKRIAAVLPPYPWRSKSIDEG